MNTVAESDITKVIFELLKETFEGPASTGPSAFLDKNTGLFQTLDGISADLASNQARPEGSTVAAHAEHIRFYVAVHHKLMHGVTDQIDWNESWKIKSVTAEEWTDLRKKLLKVYESVTDHLQKLEKWSADEISLSMSIISHTAYHLGAIRQLVLAVQP